VHQDSILANLIDEDKELSQDAEKLGLESDVLDILLNVEKFHTIRLEACDDALNSNWPEFMSTARIKAKYETYRRAGQVDVFYMEFRNMIVAGEDAAFNSGRFKYYDEIDNKEELKYCENIIIVDPAKTANLKSADSAIICVGFNPIHNRIYFRDSESGKFEVEQIFQKACDMYKRFHATAMGFEITGLNNFATYPLQQFINNSKFNTFFNIVELKASIPKELRIAALAPFYKMGVIYHNKDKSISGKLETQLLGFPYSKLWDVMDAFAHMIQMFALGNRSFNVHHAEISTVEETNESIENEYKILEIEDKMDEMLPKFRVC
jgi:hypothetical protein